jgi:hypothetical protein
LNSPCFIVIATGEAREITMKLLPLAEIVIAISSTDRLNCQTATLFNGYLTFDR